MFKIEISDSQPIHKIIFALEQLGYSQFGVPLDDTSYIETIDNKKFIFSSKNDSECSLVSLQYLKNLIKESQ